MTWWAVCAVRPLRAHCLASSSGGRRVRLSGLDTQLSSCLPSPPSPPSSLSSTQWPELRTPVSVNQREKISSNFNFLDKSYICKFPLYSLCSLNDIWGLYHIPLFIHITIIYSLFIHSYSLIVHPLYVTSVHTAQTNFSFLSCFMIPTGELGCNIATTIIGAVVPQDSRTSEWSGKVWDMDIVGFRVHMFKLGENTATGSCGTR